MATGAHLIALVFECITARLCGRRLALASYAIIQLVVLLCSCTVASAVTESRDNPYNCLLCSVDARFFKPISMKIVQLYTMLRGLQARSFFGKS
jgi:hypothetical protein